MPDADQEKLEALSQTVAHLLQRQRELERRLAALEGGAPAPSRVISVAESVPLAPVSAQTPVAQIAAEPARALEARFGLTLVNRIGVITLVIGVAFFFKWAVDNNWIGPGARVALGILAGLLTIAVADLLWRKAQQVFAQGVTGAGVAILYLSGYAAFALYHLLPQALVFAFLCAVTAGTVALASRYNSIAIAALGLFGGYITPLLLSTGEDHPWFLFTYVLVLNAAALRLSAARAWGRLEILALIATWGIYGAWLGQNYGAHKDSAVATLAPLAYFGLFIASASPVIASVTEGIAAFAVGFVWPDRLAGFFGLELLMASAALVYARVHRFAPMATVAFAVFWLAYGICTEAAKPADVTVLAGLAAGFVLFSAASFWSVLRNEALLQSLWIFSLSGIAFFLAAYFQLYPGHKDAAGLVAFCLAVVYAGCAVRVRSVALLCWGLASLFVALGVAVTFERFTVTLAWAAEAAVLGFLAARLRVRKAAYAAAILLGFCVLRIAVLDAWHSAEVTLWNARFLTFLATGVAALAVARWSAGLIARRLPLIEYVCGHLLLLVGLSLEVISWAARNSAVESRLSVQTVALTIVYALYALLLVGAGVAMRAVVNRVAGLILIGFVILKLYAFDVWQLDRVYRIAAFLVLGLLLISTSFLYSRFRGWIEGLVRNDVAEHSR